MGISINVYRVGKSEHIEDLTNIENQLTIAEDTKVDLYKMTEDLAIIFTNKPDPYYDKKGIPYKMLFGNRVQKTVDRGEIGGFIPGSEIASIVDWIKKNKINTYQGFENMYDNLSSESKKTLVDIGSPEKSELFNGYIKPLTVLYFTALQYNNSIVFIGE